MTILFLLIVIHGLQTLIAASGAVAEYQWHIWDFVNLFTIVSLAFLLYVNVDESQPINQPANPNKEKLKMLSFLFLIISGFSLFSFIILSFFADTFYFVASAMFFFIVVSLAYYVHAVLRGNLGEIRAKIKSLCKWGKQ